MLLLLPMIAVGSARTGAYGAAAGYLLAEAVFTPISLAVFLHTLRLSLIRLANLLYRPVLASAAMFAAVRGTSSVFGEALGQGASPLLALLLYATVGGASYLGCLYAFWRFAGRPNGPELTALRFLHAKLGPCVREWRSFGRRRAAAAEHG